MTRTIAVYGGSFDPPHAAHLLVAAWVTSCADVDALVFVPTAEHSLGKSSSASFEHRLAMVERVSARVPGSNVSAIEASLPRPSRTLATLEALSREHPDASLRLVVGADIAAETSRWHRWEAIVALAPPIWIGREGHDPGVDVRITLPDISSTAIRADLRTGGDVRGILPDDVRRYIAEHELYRGSP